MHMPLAARHHFSRQHSIQQRAQRITAAASWQRSSVLLLLLRLRLRLL
jgi:hypothetical protein